MNKISAALAAALLAAISSKAASQSPPPLPPAVLTIKCLSTANGCASADTLTSAYLGGAQQVSVQGYYAPGDGSADSEFALMSADDARPQFFAGNRLLDGQSPETDFEVGYVTTFLDGSLALQANAAYQVNFAGQSGTNAVSLLSRPKINF